MVKILLLSFKVVYCEICKISKTLQLLENILYFVQQVRGKEKRIRQPYKHRYNPYILNNQYIQNLSEILWEPFLSDFLR